ncbi:MAG: GFA family protein [Pseudomonadota bacterium]
MKRSGSCLCGAVTFEIDDPPTKVGACHCGMCRKWSGGSYLAIHLTKDQVRFEGEAHIGCYTSSEWAERGFCRICGSSLFYRVTAPGPHAGDLHLGFGTLDDQSGMHLEEEIFIDLKPEGYSFSQKTATMTEADVMALFAEVSEQQI